MEKCCLVVLDERADEGGRLLEVSHLEKYIEDLLMISVETSGCMYKSTVK
jgi:hypothetical protein